MDLTDLDTVIHCAELAPSVHNTQPWTCTVRGDAVEIRADQRHRLPVLDPTGRELTISCGAAVEFAGIAMRGLGWECTQTLLPDPNDPDVLAVLQPGQRTPASVEDRDLLEAIPRRYTDRDSYEPCQIGPELLRTLSLGVSQRGGWLRVLEADDERLAVVQALAHAEAAEAADPAYRAELESWLRVGHAPDGIPIDALGDLEAGGLVSDVPLRDFTGRGEHPHPGGDGPLLTVERDTVVMIGTAADTTLDWLHAGQALGWLLLMLTAAGMSSQPLGQALDVESSRLRLAREMGLTGNVQFLLRSGIGHGTATTGRRHPMAEPAISVQGR